METALASTQPLPLGIGLWLASLVGMVGAFLYGARALYRRWRLVGVGLLWVVAVTGYAYGSFRVVCSRPVTCDVGADPFSFHYLVTVAPSYGVVAAVAFGLTGLLAVREARRREAPDNGVWRTVGTMIAGLIAWVGTRLLVFSV